MVSSKSNCVVPMDDNQIFYSRKPKDKEKLDLSRQASIRSTYSEGSYAADVEALRSTNIIFIKEMNAMPPKAKGKISKMKSKAAVVRSVESGDIPTKYQILNSCGEQIFQAVETTENMTKAKFQEGQNFNFSVVDNDNSETFSITGQPGLRGIGARVTVKRGSTVVGNIIQTNKLTACCKLPPTYDVEGFDGKIIQTVKRQRSKKFCSLFSTDDFNIYNAHEHEKSQCIGKISRQKQAISLEEYSTADTYALSFHTELDGKCKALLIATVIMLDFDYFEDIKRNGSLLSRFSIVLIALLILLTAILLVVVSMFDFIEERKGHFPGKIYAP